MVDDGFSLKRSMIRTFGANQCPTQGSFLIPEGQELLTPPAAGSSWDAGEFMYFVFVEFSPAEGKVMSRYSL
jgi:hypothetical protein